MKDRLKFKEQFKESLGYLKECYFSIFIILSLFFISAVFGFVFYSKLTFLDSLLRELLMKTVDMDGRELTVFIFQNNMVSGLYGMIGGIFLGIFPIINAIVNGTVLGYVFGRLFEFNGITDFWRILPHGIFELPAIFIALGMGLRLGSCIFKPSEFKRRFYNSLNAFLFVVVPLLIFAAVIESLLIVLL